MAEYSQSPPDKTLEKANDTGKIEVPGWQSYKVKAT